jgi:Bacteriocin-protection, YdeI or OmpD-Associated/Domain of unknown function (DUF1905)
MRIHTTIRQTGKTTTGIEVPPEVLDQWGAGRRPPVRVTINGYTYRTTVGVMDGVSMISLSAQHREGAAVAGGDEVDVDIEHDTAPRCVEVPEDFEAAMDASPSARRTFDAASNSNKGWHVSQVTSAKTDETRERRIAKSIAMLEEGRVR